MDGADTTGSDARRNLADTPRIELVVTDLRCTDHQGYTAASILKIAIDFTCPQDAMLTHGYHHVPKVLYSRCDQS